MSLLFALKTQQETCSSFGRVSEIFLPIDHYSYRDWCGVTISGLMLKNMWIGYLEHGSVVSVVVVLGWWLDLKISKVFCNLYNSVGLRN